MTEAFDVAAQAALTLTERWALGSILVLSLMGNAVLVWRLVACWRSQAEKE